MFHSEQLCVANHRGNGWVVLIERENQPDANCQRLWSIKSSSMRGFHDVRDDPEEMARAQNDVSRRRGEFFDNSASSRDPRIRNYVVLLAV
jgi:hypothetical protein